MAIQPHTLGVKAEPAPVRAGTSVRWQADARGWWPGRAGSALGSSRQRGRDGAGGYSRCDVTGERAGGDGVVGAVM